MDRRDITFGGTIHGALSRHLLGKVPHQIRSSSQPGGDGGLISDPATNSCREQDGGESRIRLELPAATLGHLMDAGHLCVADFRCLDCESKYCVWRMCLMACMKQIKTEQETAYPCAGCGRCSKEGDPASKRTQMSETKPILPVVNDR